MSANVKSKKKTALVCMVKGNACYNDHFHRFVKSPCECTQALTRVASGGKKISNEYYIEKSELYDGVRISTNPVNNKQSYSHTVVPCERLFVKKDSKGTRLLQRWTGNISFPGCQAIEDQLINEGKINNESMDILSLEDVMAHRPNDEPMYSNVIVDPANMNITHGVWAPASKWASRKNDDYPFAKIDYRPFFTSPEYKKIPKQVLRPLKLYYIENPDNLTMREIAKQMRLPLSTFHKRIQKGKEAVKQAIEDYTMDIKVKNGEFKNKTWVERLLFAIFNPKFGLRDDF